MNDRSDRKLRQVAVGSYSYRHEAEFAAGFLQSAGIPYRLQIEDPTLGLSASESATLWVHAMDERRARAVLDAELALEDDDMGLEPGDRPRIEAGDVPSGDGWAPGEGGEPGGAPGIDDRPDVDGAAGAPAREPSATVQEAPGRVLQRNMKPDLTLRQRMLSIVFGLGGSTLMGVDAVVDAHPVIPWLIVVGVVAFVLMGILGRAPRPLKDLLATFSGDVP